MELHHRFEVPSPLDKTWRAFNELEGVAPCFPGATLTGVEGDEFSGSVKVKLGPISMVYSGTGRFIERDEANHRVVIEAAGKDRRGNGTAGATVTARLTPSVAGTEVTVDTDMNVTGKPAQFGRGVIQDVSDKLLDRFVACLVTTLPDGERETGVEPGSGGSGPVDARPDSGTVAAGPYSGPIHPGADTSPVDAGPDSGTAGPSPERSPAAGPTPAPTPRRAPEPPAGLDFGATLVPVLLKRYGRGLAVAASIVVAVTLLARRRRRG
ncbi:SRPBCC domain-containing protein [Saxibacter everestensis]|uniref:SRPBCC domain-containing protein n=1 Tax=Saxibacter everestensis TaxID=2909229 RepID=A0ABY8QV60_9MICO|nr:SRPBCC domain-containing protein [Brevibacteriaceae bacterium ZFBP1038]